MFPEPSVRSACEECHDRKIRCQTPAEGGSCQACQASGRQCYFLPRYKSGRPRKDSTSPAGSWTRDSSYEDLSIDLSSPSSFPPSAFDTQYTADSQAAHKLFNWPSACTHFPSPMKIPELDPSSTAFDSFRDHSAFSQQDIRRGRLPDRLRPSLSEFTLNESSRGSTATSNTSPSPEKENQPGRAGGKEFAVLLEHCTTLQRHSEELREGGSLSANTWTSDNQTQVQWVLKNIDSSCALLFGTFGHLTLNSASEQNATVDPALLALTVSTALKIFEVCDLLIQNRIPSVVSLNTMLLLKRLDFNVMQARVAVSHVGQMKQSLSSLTQDANKKAWLIDQRFKSMRDAGGLGSSSGGEHGQDL